MEWAIRAQNVRKRLRRHRSSRPSTLHEYIARGLSIGRQDQSFWALDDVSFAVPHGRSLGVIGRNGAGKSTLLRLLCGVGRPTSGTIAVQGRIGALLDLGAGFHPDLTGRENVFVNGAIAGQTRRQTADRLDSIIEFSELQDFIDQPYRTYSSGMQMRLAFAVAVHTDPDILMIDEVLAVGDASFQAKCLQRIDEFKANGCTIVLISHDLDLVRRRCDDVVWLRNGRIAGTGPSEAVVDQYLQEIGRETLRRTQQEEKRDASGASGRDNLRMRVNRFGSLDLELTEVRLLDASGKACQKFDGGAGIKIEISYLANRRIDNPIIGVTISREDDLNLYENNLPCSEAVWMPGRAGQLTLDIERLDLTSGRYYVNVGAYESEWSFAYDYHWHAYSFEIDSGSTGAGLLQLPARWQVEGAG